MERARRVNDLLVAPIGVLPTAEGDVVRPFRLGLGAEIAARRKPEVPATALKRAIHDYARSFLYVFAAAQPGSMRHDLAGTPVEPVSETDRHDAQRDSQSRIARARLRRAEREAEASREATSPIDADPDGTGASCGLASPDPAEGPNGVMDAERSTRPCV
ncbi:ProQ/FINO family protein [Methylobacterium sp. NEAU 140]|uniref:ProQ/FINO family protein n=1 Tax=Methylobacterium sp. NEAU 140 TaxID=3064945 RepID=UPI0027359FB1|nr:ProQ/FINO family protein [Methylobacterium sp. NEAU 140]MDP4026136.1 ProQ/FINO family protein [Methylobacterium sp. NEAU 140]MDP4026774.1 ProQ/FINO family protein [Methylobacterium sp. NEAU 140]